MSSHDFEYKYRKLLWETHAGGAHLMALYGDDGEMQCAHADCMHDFKRDDIEQLEKSLWRSALLRASKVMEEFEKSCERNKEVLGKLDE